MANTAILAIKILADASGAAKTMDSASGKAGKFSAGLAKVALPAAAVAAGLVAMTKSAVEDAQGQAMLAQALRKTAHATDASIASTEEWITKTSMATGVADDELRPALATLARATGDAAKSQQIMKTALDVSAATGKPLEAVTAALGKAYGGQTTALGKLVPGMSKAVLKSGDFNKVMGELAAKTGGAAAAAADTAGGRLKRMSLAVSETQEAIGGAFLPILNTIIPVLMSAASWVQNNTQTVMILIGVLAGLAVIVGVVNVAMKLYAAGQAIVKVATMAWTAAQWLLNSAMTANPIGLIILAIAALVGIIILAYNKSTTFRLIVQAAFKAIGAAAAWVRGVIVGAWNGIKNAINVVWTWIKNNIFAPWAAAYKVLSDVATAMIKPITDAWEAIKDAIESVWNWIRDNIFAPFSKAIEAVVGWLEKIKIPKWVQWAIDHVSALFGKSAAPAPAVATTRGGAQTTATGGPGGTRLSFGNLVVNIDLDGKRLGGAVRRIVADVLDDEGFALVSGTWG